MRTHSDIGLVIADLLHPARFWLCSLGMQNPGSGIRNRKTSRITSHGAIGVRKRRPKSKTN